MSEFYVNWATQSEILRLYSIDRVDMETTKTSHFTCQSKCFISIFFICQVSACKLQPFSCHDLANDIYWQTAETVFTHLNYVTLVWRDIRRLRSENPSVLKPAEGKWKNYYYHYQISSLLSSSWSSSSSSSSSLLLLWLFLLLLLSLL